MANVTFRRGTEANLPSSGMADEGCFFLAEDTGNLYVGDENGNLVPINRSPYYGTCPTEASTNSKVVTIDVNSDVFSLSEGVMISVRFANANTAASPTLNVNGSGAIAVKSYGTTSIGDTEDSSWHAGEVVTFIYDGTYWMFVGGMGNIQPDWEQDTDTADDYIKNKPYIRAGIGSKSIVESSIETNESIGNWSHSEGARTIAYSNASHAEGLGVQNTILLTSSTDEGSTDKDYQVFIGASVPIVGNVIGYNGNYVTVTATHGNRKITLSETLGTLYRSSVKVFTSSAKGVGSHTEGESTMTNNQAEHAEGAYNLSNTGDTDAEKTISSIGIGTSNAVRKNAVEVMRNGNVYIYGVGNYDGTNIASASTLQTVIGNSANVQSDWEEDDNTSPSYIQDKPSIKSGTGEYSIVEGDLDANVASGNYSHAEGYDTEASGFRAHSEGISSIAYGNSSHSEGSETLSYGSASHAEGFGDGYNTMLTSTGQEDGKEYTCGRATTSVLDVGNVVCYNNECVTITSRRVESNTVYIVLSSTLGELTNAQARVFHSTAMGLGSHIEGRCTTTLNEGEHAEGTYNKSHSGSTLAEKTISSIGIGDGNGNRANAIEVMKNGDVYIDRIGGYNEGEGPSTLQDVIDGIQSDIQTISETQSDWEEDDTESLSYIQNKPSIKSGIGVNSIEEGSLSSNYAIGRFSHAEGNNRIASGDYSHAEGGGFSLTITISGSDTTYSSSSMNLLKVGDLIVYGNLLASVTGFGKSQFFVSSSLGTLSNAYVEVYVDGAIGPNSHVEGWGTIALNKAEHAEGKFNVSHNTKDATISSIGIGTDNDDRLNAVEVLSNGDVYIKGIGLYLGDSLSNASSIQEVISDINSSIHSYTIASVSPDTGYLTAYQLKQDNTFVGAKINIPKDMVVSSGEVKTVTVADEPYAGAQVGDKYIDLTIANATTDHLYIPVKDLVDVYTEGNGIDISSGNVVSVVIDQNSSNGLSVGASGVALATATTSSAGAMSAADKTKLEGIASGAEVNQNAFSNVVVGNTTIAADSKTDTLTLEAGGNITLTTDATNDKVTIAASVPSPADANPLMDGTAAIGRSTDYAREDHVHPSDISKQDVLTAGTDLEILPKSTVLPDGYIELEYIESTGGQCIDTGVLLSNTDKFEIKFQRLATTTTMNPMFGAISGGETYTSTDNFSITYVSQSYAIYCDGNAGNAKYAWRKGDITDRNIHTIVYNGLNIAPTIDGVSMTQGTSHTLTQNTPTVTTWLFGINTNGGGIKYGTGLRVFYFKILRGNTIVRDMYPARRLSDSAVGMYDVANDVFYQNLGDGAFDEGAYIGYGGSALINFTNETGYITSADIANKADKVSNATNGNFAGLDGYGNLTDSGYGYSSFLPSSTAIPDDSDLVHITGAETVTGAKTFSSDVKVPAKIIIQGSNTSNTTRFITSDASNNIYASVGGVASLCITNNEVRRGGSASSVNLGTSSYPWNNAYAKKFITDGGTSSQLVRGDGTLATISTTDQYEAYLLWGGKNFSSNNCSPVDAALVSELGANRSQFISPTYILVEYSRDGGETWIDYEATDAQKGNLFSIWSLSGLRLGKATTKGEMTSDYMLRVTITNTSGASFYGTYNKFVIYCTTEGASGCYCTIQGRTKANVDNDTDTWTTFRDQVGIGGWSGYNVINYPSGFTTYGSGWQSSYYRQVRFVFGCTSGPSSSYYGFQLGKIMCFSKASYTVPSNMARHGHLYDWNRLQEATFPAKVTAPTLRASSKLTVGTDGDVTQYMVYDGKEIVDELGTTYPLNNHYIDYSGTWVSSTTYGHYVIPMAGVRMVRLKAPSESSMVYSFIKNYVFASPPTSDYAEGYTSREQRVKGQEIELVVPSDAEYLFLYIGEKSTQPYKPTSIKLYGTMVTRTHNEDVYYERMEPLTAEDAVVSDWRDHDVTSMILSGLVRYGYINSSNIYKTSTNSAPYYSAFIPLSSNLASIKVVAGTKYARVAFLTKEGVANNAAPSFSSGTTSTLISAGDTQSFQIPSDAKWLYVSLDTLSNEVYTGHPKALYFTGNRGVENFPLKFGNMSYDGSFEATIPSFTGATTNSNGVEGLVTAPMIADKDKFLKGDGTWAIPEGTLYSDFVGSDDGHIGTHGLVPAPSMSSAPKILTSDRTTAWQTKDSLDIASKTYVDNMIGDIETLLAAI